MASFPAPEGPERTKSRPRTSASNISSTNHYLVVRSPVPAILSCREMDTLAGTLISYQVRLLVRILRERCCARFVCLDSQHFPQRFQHPRNGRQAVSFDALAMHAVRDELEATILGGHVEKVVALSELEIGLRIRSQRRDFDLLLSADAQAARIHLVRGTLRRLTEEVTPFLLLMRKYVREGRIVRVEQPPLERIITLGIEKRLEDESPTDSSLIIEAMGRHSNVILVGSDGLVLDAIKRVPPSLSRQRPVLPHLRYSFPPAAEKLSPWSPLLARQLATASRQNPPSTLLWRFLQEAVGGTGPLTAREAVFRACADVSISLGRVTAWQPVADALADLFRPLQTHQWSPCVVVQDGDVTQFAPYLLTQFPKAQVERVDGISEAIERAFSEKLRLRPHEALRAPLRSSVQALLERVRRKEESLRQAMSRGEKAETLKRRGQAILASTAAVKPGQAELGWENQVIALDPKLSPAENAQRYFREYAKARDAAREIPALLESARHEREYLEQMLAMVELAEEESDLRAISRELAEGAHPHQLAPKRDGGKGKERPGKPKSEAPQGAVKRFTSAEGYQVLVGGSARGNERVTFDLAMGEDLWLHARGVPGAHVVVKLAGRTISRPSLLEAARMAAWYSQARGSTRVSVDYTLQRYVKKVKGGPPGLVTYSQEKTIRVEGTKAP